MGWGWGEMKDVTVWLRLRRAEVVCRDRGFVVARETACVAGWRVMTQSTVFGIVIAAVLS